MHDQKGTHARTPRCILATNNRRAMEGLVEQPNLAEVVISPLLVGAHMFERGILPPLHYAVEAGKHGVSHVGSAVVDLARRIVSTV